MRTFFTLQAIVTISLLFSCTSTEQEKSLQEKAAKIHAEALTIDSHTDTPLRLMRPGSNLFERNDPREGGGKIDFPRMKEGGLDGVFFAVFVGQGPRTPEGHEDAKQQALATFDSIYALLRKHPEVIQPGYKASDLKEMNEQGKLAIYFGMENGYPIGTDLGLLQKFYDLGTRYITLCHGENNDICDSSTDEEGPEHGGLSEFGERVIREMNRLGIMIDVSHISDEAFYDVLITSEVPVIASHSSVRALCDHPRNLDDEMLLSLADNGGVIQVCAVSDFIKEGEPYPERDSAKMAVVEKHGNYYELPPEAKEAFLVDWFAVDTIFPPHLATVSEFVDHIDHIASIAGIDHIGIGTDFDGGGGLKDCFDVSELGNITLELVRRGYNKEDINKIWGGNLLRVFKEVEEYSQNQAL